MAVTQPQSIEPHEAWLPQEHPLHRPRHGGRQLVALISAAVFLLGPLLANALGARAAEFENRALTPFPSVGDGWGFFTGLPAWAADHLPFRDVAVSSADGISRGVFREPAPFGEQNTPQQAPVPGVGGPIAPPPPAQASPSTPTEPVDAGYATVIEGQDGWLYLGRDISAPCRAERSINDTIADLQRLRSAVEASGRRFEVVVAPNKSTMVPENLPDDYVGEECAAQVREEFWRRLPAEAGVIDLRESLTAVRDQNDAPLYYPGDSHWSHLGGLTMSYRLVEALSPGISGTWQIEQTRTFNAADDIAPLIGRASEHTYRVYSLAPDGTDDRTRPLNSNFREALRLTSDPITGTIDTPTRMIADSFSQLASPYLAAAFNDLTVVHADTVRAGPGQAARMLAEGETVILEVAERTLAGGNSPVLQPPVLDAIEAELAARPLN